ncbi:fe(3+) dicitrate transport system permease protein fecD, partial [Vibrio parahaemolyticus SBR10290]
MLQALLLCWLIGRSQHL